jgi:carbamoyl-phosphate synthase large subunit
MATIIVTGVGGGVGQSIVKSLRGTGHRVIGLDGEPLATGLYAVDRGYTIPYAAHLEYIEVLLDISRREHGAILFPGLDAELLPLARAARQFREAGTQVVVSAPEIVELCDDKLATAQFLSQNGFFAPATQPLSLGGDGRLSFPLILKPRKGGARSQGVYLVHDRQELESRLPGLTLDNYVAQEHIEGDEYTCGTVSFAGKCYGTILMRRILRDGDTYKAFVVKDDALADYVRTVAEALQPHGPCNFQLRVRDGRPYIFECNARCSGTTYCRALAGFNEPVMIADYLLHGKKPSYDIRELSILRYWKELVVTNERIDLLKKRGFVDSDRTVL